MRQFFKAILVIISIGLVVVILGTIFLPLPGTVPVLMYHFIGTDDQASRHKSFVSRENFAWQMAYLKLLKFNVLSLDELSEIVEGKRKAKGREVVITFDDGNYSFLNEAYPLLKAYGFPVTIFLVSESIKQKIHGSMTEEDLKSIQHADWLTFGSHTKTHPMLTRLDPQQIDEELAGSKQDLEAMFGMPIHYLAYPSGDVNQQVLDSAEKAGYRLAFTSSYKQLKGLNESPLSFPRVKISRTSNNPFVFWFKVSGLYQLIKRERAKLLP